jgi:alpha-ribazole phosphatase
LPDKSKWQYQQTICSHPDGAEQRNNNSMASIYLIRHTRPAIEKGTCYGQSDLDIMESFESEAAIIEQYLPASINIAYSSPLQRCRKLAQRLFPEERIAYNDALMEIHCGLWEMRRWDDIPREDLDLWMADYIQVRIPGGESYIDLYERVIGFYTSVQNSKQDVALVAHGGVIRSILSHITGTPLLESFGRFSLHYGCVVRLDREGADWGYTILSNITPPEKEQHKPSPR